jgi:preprotein translocase subunit SecF
LVKTYLYLLAIILSGWLCLVMACSSTMLRGTVLTADNRPGTNLEIKVSAELDSHIIKTTKVNPKTGSFILKGLESNKSYKIIAECSKDETKAVAENVYLDKGKNELQSNKNLTLPIRTTAPASTDTSSPPPSDKGGSKFDSP